MAAFIGHTPNAAKGVMLMICGMGLLTINDATVKWLAGAYPVGQVLAMRALASIPPILLLAHHAGGLDSLRIRSWRGQSVRAFFMVASTWLFVTGLTLLPLADTVAVAFMNPLILTALAALLLGETIGWRRWTAVLVGFLGVLVIMRPTGDAIQLAVLFPLGAAFCGALRDAITRRISATESSVAILMLGTVAVGLSGLVTLPAGGWAMPTWRDLGLVALSGVLLAGAHFLMIETFRFAEAGLVAPFKYTSFLWALVLGVLIWGDWPTPVTLLGAAIVAGSGIYVFRREVGHKRGPAAASPMPATRPSPGD